MAETHTVQSDDGTSTSKTNRSNAERPPRLRGFPLIGRTLSIARDPLEFLESAREYDDVVVYEAYGTEFALVSDPALVETILVSRADEFRKGEFETGFGELIAPSGIAFTEGERWRRQRNLLQSSFTPDRVRSAADGMVTEASALVDGWDDGETIVLRDALSAYTLRVLSRTLFDLPLEDDRTAIVRRATTALDEYASPRRLALESIVPSWLPTPAERKYENAMGDLEALVADLVETRRTKDAAGDDLLSLLARAEYPDGTRLTPTEIRDQLVTFLFAGHETTATTLTFACWLLADDSAVRSELERELEAVCGDRDPTIADLEDLEYTEAVVNEAMRLYPPITSIYREPCAETVLGNHLIPAGTTLQLPVYGIHRDDRWWSAPEAFRPERWLNGSNGGLTRDDRERPEYAYYPFGGGPRHCLGMRFAMVELQLALATLVSKIVLEQVTESLEPSLGVTLDPGSVEARVRKRENSR
ncbi:cytochrome P450 [Natrarchaeobius halalkaliphilus]|uniref:Cytochrome P450 n=1 Tax=Natrarchaeobius halalkaliphilus TaxID=1679091 RepID=A0A3N6MGU4_9EURY|nr:cytochrome P450 [Natrarchaeobius halalkaliphilus]RQG93206.1 cytochrome P450 [Natrarchaeobius halalkaliphilus]